MRHLGYLCTHQDHIHDKVMEAFTDSISLWNFFLLLLLIIYFFFLVWVYNYVFLLKSKD